VPTAFATTTTEWEVEKVETTNAREGDHRPMNHGENCNPWAGPMDQPADYRHLDQEFEVQSYDPELRRQTIEEMKNKAPRFLFRIWCEMSGGDARLNTKDAITPHAFMHRPDEAPKTIYEMACEELDDMACDHLNPDKNISTVLSSWTQSLNWIIKFADKHAKEWFLSVIDTTKHDETNVILYASGMHGLRDMRYVYDYEYLIFGVVTAHKTVSFNDLFPADDLMKSLLPFGYFAYQIGDYTDLEIEYGHGMPDSKDDVDRYIGSARRLAAMFGPEFELVLTTYFVTLSWDDEHVMGWIQDAILKQSAVPDDWRVEDRFMADSWLEFAHPDKRLEFSDAERALEMLRNLIQAKEARRSNLHGKAGARITKLDG
jgi:hypothetical protein